MLQIARLIGAAGSGKTTELLRIMEGALPQLGNDPLRLGFASFTRAARAEAVSRAASAWGVSPDLLEKQGWFRTVHSTCKRCLDVQKGQLIGDSQKDLDWISNALGVRLSTQLDDEAGGQRFIGDPVVAASLNCWSLARSCLLPLELVVRRMRAIDDDVPDFAAIVRVTERYEMQKRIDHRLDFTDLLARFAGVYCSPLDGVSSTTPEGFLPDVSAWLFDEQQDASPLLDAVCKRLVSAPSVKWCYVVGDPFQCQPAGTPVLTASGYKAIEDLDSESDWLVAFNKKDGRFYGTGGGVRFKKAWRDVDSGDLFEVRFTDGTTSVCTSNHRWLVRKNGSKACRFLQATNLLPGIHVVPKLREGFLQRRKRGSGKPRGARGIGKEAEWVGVVSVRRLPPGDSVRVYSLEVDRHHTYVTTNGIVTGNSIYGFAGSSSECFLSWPAQKERTMPKSYRCPRPILELGERCLRRMSKGYFDRNVAPADHDGAVVECSLDDALSRVKPHEDWLFISRLNYHATRLFAALHSHSIPCRWVKSPDTATIRTDGLLALYTLEKNDKPITGAQWGHALSLLPPVTKGDKRPILTRGTKTRWAKEHADEWDFIFRDDLLKVGAEPALIEAIATGEWCSLVNRGHEWRQQAIKHGPEIAAHPRVRVGTIHSVKGAEADNVVLLTTTGARVERGAENPDQADEEHRIAYVGVTRARRNLYVVDESRAGRPIACMEVV